MEFAEVDVAAEEAFACVEQAGEDAGASPKPKPIHAAVKRKPNRAANCLGVMSVELPLA